MKKNYTLIAMILGGIFLSSSIAYGEGSPDGKIDYFKSKKIASMEQYSHLKTKMIINKIEDYTDKHDGTYPQNLEEFTKGPSPYYDYSIEFGQNSCKVIGTPKECGETGNNVFSIEIIRSESPCGADTQPREGIESLVKVNLGAFDSIINNCISNNDGAYPLNEDDLDHAFGGSVFPGWDKIFADTASYKYTMQYRSNGYKITASPRECGKTGTRILTKEIIETSQPCEKQ